MEICLNVSGSGCSSTVRIFIDGYENGEEIGVCRVGMHDGEYKGRIKCVTGRHAVFFKVEHDYSGWFADSFNERNLFDLNEFVFRK